MAEAPQTEQYVRVGSRRRSVLLSVLTVCALSAVLLPINWQSVQWGTAPEWIAVVALLFIAVGVWRLLLNGERSRDRRDQFQ